MDNNITVIIPIKLRNPNELKWFEQCVQSVPRGTPIVIVNDHSYCDWSTVTKAVSLRGKITVEQMEDKTGLAAARNTAMEFVNTDYFFSIRCR